MKIKRIFCKKNCIFIAVMLFLVLCGIAIYLFFISPKDKNEISEKNANGSTNKSSEAQEYYIEPIDAEKYLDEIGEIKKQYNVESSKNVMSEKKLMSMLTERGFSDCSVETNYSINGEYFDAIAVSSDSTEKHPIYETYFYSTDEFVWSIEIVNGSIYASPLSYNLRDELDVPVMISETEFITSYDSATNQFFEIIPDKSEMIIKVVPEINSELLEKLTIEEIDKL